MVKCHQERKRSFWKIHQGQNYQRTLSRCQRKKKVFCVSRGAIVYFSKAIFASGAPDQGEGPDSGFQDQSGQGKEQRRRRHGRISDKSVCRRGVAQFGHLGSGRFLCKTNLTLHLVKLLNIFPILCNWRFRQQPFLQVSHTLYSPNDTIWWQRGDSYGMKSRDVDDGADSPGLRCGEESVPWGWP